MSLDNKLEILEVLNTIQNKNNHFINISEDDLERVYQYVVEKDLDLNETIQLLKDLAFV